MDMEDIVRLADELADERELMRFGEFEGAFCGGCPMQEGDPNDMGECGVSPWWEECHRHDRWRGIEAAYARARAAIVAGLEREEAEAMADADAHELHIHASGIAEALAWLRRDIEDAMGTLEVRVRRLLGEASWGKAPAPAPAISPEDAALAMMDPRDLMLREEFCEAFCGGCTERFEVGPGGLWDCGCKPWDEGCTRRAGWERVVWTWDMARHALVDALEESRAG